MRAVRVGAERRQAELGHRRLADDDRARLAQSCDGRGVCSARVVRNEAGAEPRAQPALIDLFLDGDRHAVEQAELCAGLEALPARDGRGVRAIVVVR